MTWLFTQVWLWSLAAFVLGALLSWLLFVPRLQRRIRWLRQDVVDWEAAYDEATWPAPGPSGLSLLPGQEEVDGWERQRDWDRTRMSGDTARIAPVNGTEPEVEPVEQQPAPAEQDDSDLRLEEQRTARVEPVRSPVAEAAAPDPTAPDPTAPAEREIPGAESEPGGNTWFRNPELEQVDEPTGDLDADDAQLPKRAPGVGPRPGPSAVSGVRIPGEPRNSGGEATSGEAPRGGAMVKGHFASREYHTPESPRYGEVEADVWFRTAADAEQAGFAPGEPDRS